MNWTAAAVAIVLLPSTAAADYKADFRKGMEAADLQRWEEAAESFRAAIAKNPTESEERVFLSGVFSTPYLPHYQLGRTLFLASRDNCSEALAEWTLSESHGAIRSFARLYEELVAGREECTRLLLPSAVAAATGEIDKADAALQNLPVPLSTDDRESRRQTAIDLLRQAREELRRGQTDSDLVAVQSAAETAREARTEFEQLAPLEESQTLVAEPATAEAEIAIKDAEAEMTALQALLADPGIRDLVIEDEEIRRALDLEGRIAEYGGRLESGSDDRQVETIRLEAEAAAAQLRRVRKRIPKMLASAVPAPATRPADDVPTEAAKPADATDHDGAQAIRLGHLIAEAEALLEEIDPDATRSDLLATQYARLTSILTLARVPTQPRWPG